LLAKTQELQAREARVAQMEAEYAQGEGEEEDGNEGGGAYPDVEEPEQ
jgi:hypothetical protein